MATFILSPAPVAVAAASAATRPTLFILGDSTVRNDACGEIGWGEEISRSFDTSRIEVENDAIAGRSARSYYRDHWPPIRARLKAGDFVLIQFGHNDGTPLDQGRGDLTGIGEETQEVADKKTNTNELVHTYGWYLRRLLTEIKERGATPIVLSPVPRCWWLDEHHLKNQTAPYGAWAKQVAEQQKVPFFDLNAALAAIYEPLGETRVKETYFTPIDGTHFGVVGAKLAASTVVSGIRGMKGVSLAGYLAAPGAPPGDITSAVVDASGKGDYRTIQAAIDAVPANNPRPVLIRIWPGTYAERVTIPKDKPHLTLRGEGHDRQHFTDRTEIVVTAGAGAPVLTAEADDLSVRTLTIENTAGRTAGQQQALMSFGDRQVYRNVAFKGWQDTMWLRAPGVREYFRDCEVWGSVDFIYGAATAVFDRCTIVERRDTGGYLTAPSTPQDQPYGLVFLDCKLLNQTGGKDNTVLGRPWGPYGAATFLNCTLEDDIKPQGWKAWNGREATCRVAEYDSKTPDGQPADISQRVAWSHQLTADDAATYTLPTIFHGWKPQ